MPPPAAPDEEPFLHTLRPGDPCSGTVAADGRHLTVVLDGFPGRPLGAVGPLDRSWAGRDVRIEPGSRVTGEIISVDVPGRTVWLSLSAVEHRELWAFLGGLERGRLMAGTIAAIESFGVFVALDEGPPHPVFPGVGFITMPELSWRRFERASDVVRVGERVTCEFLQFDTTNGEARLSLRATRPDPFQAFARDHRVGDVLTGTVTKTVPFGVFVAIADGIEGLARDLPASVGVGDEVTVAISEIIRPRRQVVLAAAR